MDRENFDTERRRFPRLKINITVIYKVDRPSHVRVSIGEDEVEATTIDLGEGGVAIQTDYDIPLTTVLSIEFMIYKVDDKDNFKLYKSIKATGEVHSNVLLGKNKHRLGICFTQIDEEVKSEIADFVRMGINSRKRHIF